MASRAKSLAALAALVVVAACSSTPTPSPAVTTSPIESPVASSSANPPASAAPSEAAFECDHSTGCAGNLEPGEHRSTNFVIPLQVTVPEGWVNDRDITRTYELSTPSGLAAPIEVLAMNAIPDQAACGPVPLAGAGSSVQDFIDFVADHPGLDATAPVPVTIDGYQGQSIDFGVRSDWTAMCPDIDPTSPVALMLTSTNTDPPGRQLAYAPDVRVRWIVIDVAGETVIIEVEGAAALSQFGSALAEDQPVIDSLDFTPGG